MSHPPPVPPLHDPLAATLSAADDRALLSRWLPPQEGTVPRVRVGRRWISVLWALPPGFAALILAVAVAQSLREYPEVKAFLARYPGIAQAAPSVDSGFPWLQSPSISNRLGWIGRVLDRQLARSIHFISFAWFVLFILGDQGAVAQALKRGQAAALRRSRRRTGWIQRGSRVLRLSNADLMRGGEVGNDEALLRDCAMDVGCR